MKKILVTTILAVVLLIAGYTPALAKENSFVPRQGDCFWVHDPEYTGVVSVLSVNNETEGKPHVIGWFLARPDNWDASFNDSYLVSEIHDPLTESSALEAIFFGMTTDSDYYQVELQKIINEYKDFTLELYARDIGFCPRVKPPNELW